MSGKALAIAAFGARGTGKTEWIKQYLASKKPRRLLVWDFKHDPALRDMGQGFTDLPSLIRAAGASQSFQLRYLVNHGTRDTVALFEIFCALAWKLGDLVLFVDELPEVTKANRAPPTWRKCVNVGREYTEGGRVKSLTIIGAGQRPAECDKSFIANCDVIHTGRLGDISDAKRMAQSWGIDAAELATMPDLAWLEKRADTPGVTRGVLRFSQKTQKKPVRQLAKKPST